MSEKLCIYCNGSGEGMVDRSICYNCKGMGVELEEKLERDEYDYEEFDDEGDSSTSNSK